METLRLAGVIRESIVDGPGIRFVVFAQGCPHHCPGCHNPATHDPAGGYITDVETVLAAMQRNPLLSGVTLSGGEPFQQAAPFAALARGARQLGLNVVTYTGYTFEQLLEGFIDHPEWEELLRQSDTLVDGPFLQDQKSLMLRFRGSRNQRVLSPAESLRAGRAVEKDF
jgi:anaerobic ribonucleoside-triphosphate reductase activating protein